MPRLAVAPPPAPTAKPFLKWVGGKRQLLAALHRHRPKTFGRYHEPFLGGGALYFSLSPKQAFLSDANERLIRTYRGVQASVDDVIARLDGAPHTKKHFLEMRDRNVDAGTDADVAAWFIYLNKTGFNGLYRVNSQNRYNVPFGRMKSPRICDKETLRACSAHLQRTELLHGDFRSVADRVEKNDFVYFDPPYVPLSQTSRFASYTGGGFTQKDQTDLRDLALELKRGGVHVLLSNSSHPEVRELYREHFKLTPVPARRNVNAQGHGRGAIKELLIK